MGRERRKYGKRFMAGGVKERREWVDGCVQTNFTIEGNLISEMLFVRLIREERERKEARFFL